MTVIKNENFGGNFHQKVLKVRKWYQSPFFELCECHLVLKKNQNLLFQNDSFFKLQKFIINNFYNSYEQSEIYFRKKGTVVENKRLTMWLWVIYKRDQLKKKDCQCIEVLETLESLMCFCNDRMQNHHQKSRKENSKVTSVAAIRCPFFFS